MRVTNVISATPKLNCSRLEMVKFRYFDFKGVFHHDGEIVVMDAAADHVLNIFKRLLDMRFPIAKSRTLEHYKGNDDASMLDNNTSAFNDRKVAGGSSTSLHAYGLAIDINPVQNPFVTRSGATLIFHPASGIEYANRLSDRPGKGHMSGMAEAVLDVFADDGFFLWGGYWDNPIDYQHFQVSKSLAETLVKLGPTQARMIFDQSVGRYRTCRMNGTESSPRSRCIINEDSRGTRQLPESHIIGR